MHANKKEKEVQGELGEIVKTLKLITSKLCTSFDNNERKNVSTRDANEQTRQKSLSYQDEEIRRNLKSTKPAKG